MTRVKNMVFRGHKKALARARSGHQGIYVKAQTTPVKTLAIKLTAYATFHTWKETAERFNITNDKGRPSPGLACLIAGGYQPGLKVCQRLGIKTECPTCLRPVTRNHRHLPEWVTIGADFLAEKERSRR
jgi:hypothetical protein